MILIFNKNKTKMFSFLLTKAKRVSIITDTIAFYRLEVFDLNKLDKKQLEYLSRTIMPELYERQAEKDAFVEYINENYEVSYVKDGSELNFKAGSTATSGE